MNMQTELTKGEIKAARHFEKRSVRFGLALDLAILQALRERLWRALNTEAGKSAGLEAARKILPLILLAKRSLATQPNASGGSRLSVDRQQKLVRQLFGELPPPPPDSSATFAPEELDAPAGEAPEQPKQNEASESHP